MEEMLATYNEYGKLIGKEKRSVCHRKGLIHKAVYILLFDKQGKLFLQKRSMRKSLYPGLYTASASGHVEFGESPSQAARRELFEELGVKANPIFLCKFNTFIDNDKEIGYLYYCNHEGQMKINTNEIVRSKSRFFAINEIKKLKLSPHFNDCLNAFNENKKMEA